MKKLYLILLISFLLIGLVGCGSESNTVKTDDQLSVALVVAGPVMDGAWNESGYKALELAEKELGASTVYNENTDPSDYQNVIKNYAKEGYNVIIGHGFEFVDTVKLVAKDYPDTIFLLTNSDPTALAGNGSNIGGVQGNGIQQGFLQGAMAAYMSDTGVVAGIGGLNIPAIKYGLDGYEAGAKYINKDIKVLKAMTGNFDDINQLKEQSLSMIEQNADVIMSIAGVAGRGAYDAAADKGIYAIGSVAATSDLKNYPETLVAAGDVDMAVSIVNVLKKIDDGTFDGSDYLNGIEEGAVALIYNTELMEKQFPGLKEKVDEITQKLVNGEINPEDYLEK